jgi:methionyl-tRNA formyltransferase
MKTKIVFFGSGPVAAKSLSLLHESFCVEAIITKPTTEKELRFVAQDTPVFCVSSRAELDTLIEQKKFTSKLGILIDFGILVSQRTINSFEKGIINSHFSLLPELRGPDPISFAILEGRQKTGVSLMLLVEAMDEGPILSVGILTLDGSETTPSLTDELIQLSYELLKENIDLYIAGSIEPADQTVVQEKFDLQVSYTKKLHKSDSRIDWSKDAQEIEREIRAFTGWPGSKTTFSGIDCTLLGATLLNKTGDAGTLFIHEKKLAIYCGKDALVIGELKPAGKKEMDSQSFLAGYGQRLNITS